MLLGVGSAARRHATSELHRYHIATLAWSRPFTSSTFRFNEPKLPYLLPHSFIPRAHPNPAAKDIAVLGGGVTGLTAAYELSRCIPDANITLYEKSDRLGGWIDTEIVQVDGGEILFEWGPRTLRPSIQGAGWATLHLLGSFLEDRRTDCSLLAFSKRSNLARNRFVYYPDHLVRMPSGSGSFISDTYDLVRSLWSEPIFQGVPNGILAEPFQRTRSRQARDESVGDFLSRRFGREVADNLASAVMHGIYAGDIYKLSARTLLPSLWYLEMRDSDIRGHETGQGILAEVAEMFFRGNQLLTYEDTKFRNVNPIGPANRTEISPVLAAFQESSVITWSEGMSYITRKLRAGLERAPRVTIKTNAPVDWLYHDKDTQKVMVKDPSEKNPQPYDYVISTLAPRTMRSIIRSSPEIGRKCETFSSVDKSVSVMVVNLWYRSQVLAPEHEGFGYLIPRSVPLEQNPERALGVIFAHNLTSSYDVAEETVEDVEKRMQEIEDHGAKEREHYANEARKLDERLEKATDDAERSEIEMMRSAFETYRQDMEIDFKKNDEAVALWRKDKANQPPVSKVKLGQDTVPGSKFGVMLGGHWWDGWEDGDYPSEQEAIDMAKSVLRRHLKIEEEPEVAKARLQKDCIPQYPVGYRDYMAKIHQEVLIPGFEGRLKVAGPWYQGAVGVNDCVRKAKQVVMDIREGWDQNTGLEQYTEDEKWLLKNRSSGFVDVDDGSE